MRRMLLLTTVLLTSFLSQSASLTFTAPPVWQSRPPASAMRVAEFVVPRAPGDPEDGEVIIYFFGGTGGSVDANVGDLKVTTVDVSGTYVAEVRPGATERLNKPNFSMRAAVVETPGGPYYVKFTGPASTVEAASAAFDEFIKSLRFK